MKTSFFFFGYTLFFFKQDFKKLKQILRKISRFLSEQLILS